MFYNLGTRSDPLKIGFLAQWLIFIHNDLLNTFQRPSPDLKQVLYQLLHELLVNNWRYFFKGSVLTKLNNEAETVEHEPQFISIMQVILKE